MSYRILLADDSQTIQKVVKITLSETNYALEIASSEAELFEKSRSANYGLVLLDFGLSESKSGYELAHEIKEINSDMPIVMLFGTFDTVDELELNSANVSDRIVKPFDSSQFIKICDSYLKGATGPKTLDAPIEDIFEDGDVEDSDEDNNWSVQNEPVQDIKIATLPPALDEQGAMAKELQEWSVEVPPIISGAPDTQDLPTTDNIPPVISEEDTKDITESFSLPEQLKVESKVPEEIHLEYPKKKTPPLELEDPITETEAQEAVIKLDDYDTGPDEIPVQDFWSVDDSAAFDDTSSDPIVTIEQAEQETHQISGKLAEIDTELLVEKIKPFLEEKIREYCESRIDKVAWEVIPELAENLIKKELSEIKKLVMD